MNNRYYEIIREGVSTCIDYDVAYYHHFKIGEIICVNNKHDPKLVYIMDNCEKWEIGHKVRFVLDCYSRNIRNVRITECVITGYFLEVTKGFELKELRDKKLNELGI